MIGSSIRFCIVSRAIRCFKQAGSVAKNVTHGQSRGGLLATFAAASIRSRTINKCAAGDCPEPATMKLTWIDFFDRSTIWAEWYCENDYLLFASNIRVSAVDEDFKK